MFLKEKKTRINPLKRLHATERVYSFSIFFLLSTRKNIGINPIEVVDWLLRIYIYIYILETR